VGFIPVSHYLLGHPKWLAGFTIQMVGLAVIYHPNGGFSGDLSKSTVFPATMNV